MFRIIVVLLLSYSFCAESLSASGANVQERCNLMIEEKQVIYTLIYILQEKNEEDVSWNKSGSKGILIWWEHENNSEPIMHHSVLNNISTPGLAIENSLGNISNTILAYGLLWKSELKSVTSDGGETASQEIARVTVAYSGKVGLEGYVGWGLGNQAQLDSLILLGCAPNYLEWE